MRVAVLVTDAEGPSREEGDRVLAALDRHGILHERVPGPAEVRPDTDLVVIVGDSGFLLSVVRGLPGAAPILGVGSAGFGALTEVSVEDFESHAKRLAGREFWIEEVDRMECRVGERTRGLALNEAALVAAASGQFVRYSLSVDDELVWRDRGDGVIVATPTGSTAYAFAAGGPVVLSKTRVFSVVPICSSEGNRPFVVNEEATIGLADVMAASGVEIVLDGRERIRVSRGERVRIARAKEPVSFVRFGRKRYTQVLGRLRPTGAVAHTLHDAPPSAKFLLKVLEYEGPLTQAEIVRESSLSARTVRNALGYLLDRGHVVKEPSLRDARQDVYALREAPRSREPDRS